MNQRRTKLGLRKRNNRNRRSKKKLGRPALGAAARSRVVTLKVTKAEYAAVSAAIRKRGPPATVSGWFRDHGLAALDSGGLVKKRVRG
jgi:hypothetical protein